MVKLKGAGKPPSPTPHSGELSHMEFELQLHRDETSARLAEMQSSIQDSVANTLAGFKSVLLEELKQLQLTKQGSTAISQPDGTVRFGSVPSPVIPPKLTPNCEGSSSTMARSEGSSPLIPSLNLGNDDVLLGFISEVPTSVVDATAVVHKSGSMDINKHVANQYESQGVHSSSSLASMTLSGGMIGEPHAYQFQPVNLALPPYATSIGAHSTAHPLHTHVGSQATSDCDPFRMTYSGPYSVTMLTFPCSANTTIPFNLHQQGGSSAIPHYSHSPPTYATTTTTHASFSAYQQVPQTMHSQIPPYSFQGIPPNHYTPTSQFHQANHFQVPYVDPSLPTMKQMRLDFSVFGGGDPVEWLNKADQYFEFYQIPEDRKLAIATMHLTDKASDRWYMFKHEFPNSWQGLADLLMREFSGYNRSEYQSALARMNQTGSTTRIT